MGEGARGESVNCRIFESTCQWAKTNCRPILLINVYRRLPVNVVKSSAHLAFALFPRFVSFFHRGCCCCCCCYYYHPLLVLFFPRRSLRREFFCFSQNPEGHRENSFLGHRWLMLCRWRQDCRFSDVRFLPDRVNFEADLRDSTLRHIRRVIGN